MKRNWKLTPGMIEDAAKMFEVGQHPNDIAKKLETTHAYMQRILKNHMGAEKYYNTLLKTPGLNNLCYTRARDAMAKIGLENGRPDPEEMERLFVDEGMNAHAIAAKFRMSDTTVREALRAKMGRANYEIHSRRNRQKNIDEMRKTRGDIDGVDETVQQAVLLNFKYGTDTVYAMAERYGVTREQAVKIIRSAYDADELKKLLAARKARMQANVRMRRGAAERKLCGSCSEWKKTGQKDDSTFVPSMLGRCRKSGKLTRRQDWCKEETQK